MDNQELPADILEKLRNLELELEDGDITPKGFEKKKATLLAEISQPSTPDASQPKSEAELLEELGPEPSAADVVDFLDFLPSPTHSPTRTAEATQFMEDNHKHIQQQQQQHQHQQYQQQQHQQHQQHQQQQQHQQHQQQHSTPYSTAQPTRPSQQPYRPYPVNNVSVGGGMARGMQMNPPYMGTPIPQHNRPYMTPPRNGYPQQQMRPIQSQQQPVNGYYNQRPHPPSQSNMIYRPAQPQSQQSPPQMYSTRPHPSAPQQTSPRPVFGARPGAFRPPPGQYQQQQQSYGNYQYNNSNANRAHQAGYYK